MLFSNDGRWVYIEIPNCGGGWVTKAVEGVAKPIKLSSEHGRTTEYDWPSLNEDFGVAGSGTGRRVLRADVGPYPMPAETEVICASVKHPVEWYRSYWAWRRSQIWVGKRTALDYVREAATIPSFEFFMEWSLKNEPQFLSRLYNQMIVRQKTFVWKHEFLSSGLMLALKKTDHWKACTPLPEIPKPIKLPAVSDEVASAILKHEQLAYTVWAAAWAPSVV